MKTIGDLKKLIADMDDSAPVALEGCDCSDFWSGAIEMFDGRAYLLRQDSAGDVMPRVSEWRGNAL